MTNNEAIAFLSEFQEKHLIYGKLHAKAIDTALTIAIKSIHFTKVIETIIARNEFPEYFEEDVISAYELFLKEVSNESNK